MCRRDARFTRVASQRLISFFGPSLRGPGPSERRSAESGDICGLLAWSRKRGPAERPRGLQREGERSLPLPSVRPGQPVRGVQWGRSPEEDTHVPAQAATRATWDLLWDRNPPGRTNLEPVPGSGTVLVSTEAGPPPCLYIAAACWSGPGANSGPAGWAPSGFQTPERSNMCGWKGNVWRGPECSGDPERIRGPVLDRTELNGGNAGRFCPASQASQQGRRPGGLPLYAGREINSHPSAPWL